MQSAIAGASNTHVINSDRLSIMDLNRGPGFPARQLSAGSTAAHQKCTGFREQLAAIFKRSACRNFI